ncbi:MAG: glycosyltransferase [Saprospiraceae bacterium]|nr:glycosyltransferase [Saprospiraceae bacterium]
MPAKKIIYHCVTNDLTYDQRLLKKAESLRSEGWECRLVGRHLKDTKKPPGNYRIRRFKCWFNRGFFFYLEFNIRLFLFLILRKWHVVESNDADTLLACGLASKVRRRILVYDSHEYFTEVPELQGKYIKRWIWHRIQLWFVPDARLAITVGPKLALRLSHDYHRDFISVRNLPEKKGSHKSDFVKVMIYQGALNEGRGLEELIDATLALDEWQLWIAGGGPLEDELRSRVEDLALGERVTFYGRLEPDELHRLTVRAGVGLNLLKGDSLNYYYSLANKFFDYVQAGIPGISMDFPEYKFLCEEFDVALLLEDVNTSSLIKAINKLESPTFYQNMKEECRKASDNWIWESEKAKLLSAYQSLLEEEE